MAGCRQGSLRRPSHRPGNHTRSRQDRMSPARNAARPSLRPGGRSERGSRGQHPLPRQKTLCRQVDGSRHRAHRGRARPHRTRRPPRHPIQLDPLATHHHRAQRHQRHPPPTNCRAWASSACRTSVPATRWTWPCTTPSTSAICAAPRVRASGPQITTTAGHAWHAGVEVDGLDDIRHEV